MVAQHMAFFYNTPVHPLICLPFLPNDEEGRLYMLPLQNIKYSWCMTGRTVIER